MPATSGAYSSAAAVGCNSPSGVRSRTVGSSHSRSGAVTVLGYRSPDAASGTGGGDGAESASAVNTSGTDSSSPTVRRMPSSTNGRTMRPRCHSCSAMVVVAGPVGNQRKLPSACGIDHPWAHRPARSRSRRSAIADTRPLSSGSAPGARGGIAGGVGGRRKGGKGGGGGEPGHLQREGRGARGIQQVSWSDRVADPQTGQAVGLLKSAHDNHIFVPTNQPTN